MTEGLVAAFARGRSTADVSGTWRAARCTLDLAQRRADVQGVGARRTETVGKRSIRGSRISAHSISPPTWTRISTTRTSTCGWPRRFCALRRKARCCVSPRSSRCASARGRGSSSPRSPAEPALRFAMAYPAARWFQRFVPAARIEGGRFSGTLEVVRDAERTTVLVAQPIKVDGHVTLRPINGIEAARVRRDARAARDSRRRGARSRGRELRITARTGFVSEFKGRATTSRDAWPVVSLRGRHYSARAGYQQGDPRAA